MESLNLFEEICNNQYFARSSIILFLNKIDVFEEKIKTTPIKTIQDFSDYKGKDDNVHDGVEYYKKKFTERNKYPKKRTIYLHVTCATDTDNVHEVFESIRDIVLYASAKVAWKN